MTWRLCGVFAAVLLAAAACGGAQVEAPLIATLDKPAVMTATQAALPAGARHVLLSIVAFTPPADKKPVEIVVRAARPGGGASREIGRVAITPYAAFGPADTARRQNFAFSLPADLAGEPALTLSVALVAVIGGGKGASLQLGTAAIQ